MKLIEKQKINKEKEIRILNKALVRYGIFESSGKQEKYIEIFPKSFEHKMLDEILLITGKKHDCIFLIRAGMGEAYLLNFILKELLLKFNAKNPCFVCHRKQYKELFELYHPNIPFYHINIDINKLFPALINRIVKYRGHFFNINPSTLAQVQDLFNRYENKLEKRHYTEVIKNFNNVSVFNFVTPVFSEKIKNSTDLKTKKLNKDNFIFIVNDANFIQKIPHEFWSDLITDLKKKNYDIFINNPDFSISEAFYLASKSKGIISLRCGFSELLSTLNVDKHIIYTPCKHNYLPQLLEIMTLKKYPFVDPTTIFEYDAQINDVMSIKNIIMGAF